jgi:small subunit ribosomal protein S16
MAVTIRLSRQGAKKNPQYLVVAVDSARKRDGAYLENLGHYYPKAKAVGDKIKVDLAAIQAWKLKGAQVSQTVGQLLKGITTKPVV